MLKITANRSLSLPCLAISTCIHRSNLTVGNRQLGSQLRSKFLQNPRADLYHSSMSSLNPEATYGKFNTLGASANIVSKTTGSELEVLVQYVVLRSDLWKSLDWPLGSIVAQACHAATAALWLSRTEEPTLAYCSDSSLDHMHKVVLEVKGEAQLTNLAQKLQEAGVPHKLWVEQPENFPTCLATSPSPKSLVQQHFKKLKLCKGS